MILWRSGGRAAACRALPAAAARPAWRRPFSSSPPRAGRVVLTHSTHCPGLIDALERVVAAAPAVRTLIPARLATARGNATRLELRVSTATPAGWKVIARKGTQVQEVFVVTDLPCDALQRELDAATAPARR
jgi:hypothetical protein